MCGGRDYDDHAHLDYVLNSLVGKTCTLLIHGNARGADQLAMGWALFLGIEQPACAQNSKGVHEALGKLPRAR